MKLPDGLAEKADVKTRKDRIGCYFKKYLKQFVFDEFSEGYLKKAGACETMKAVPVPLRKADMEHFLGGEGVPMHHLVENMAWVMGADPHFEYTSKYAIFLEKLFSGLICSEIVKKGRDAAEKGDLDKACIYFRAALCVSPVQLDGMYSYARACREMYLQSDDEEYTGRFKAEAMDFFELTTEAHPGFAQAYYYLGYAYLNIGLYMKTELAWKSFLKYSRNPRDKKEIRERLAQIAEPVQIEQGCNMAISGRYEQGIAVLAPFMETKFKAWWPLSYYLGVCYARLGMKEDALKSFKNVLTMNASHVETMEELADIYASLGDRANEEKYFRKIELVVGSL